MDQISTILSADTGYIYAVFMLSFCNQYKLQCFNPLYDIGQRSPKLLGCWAKFAILSASTGRTILRIEKTKTAGITLITFVYIAICFSCLLTCLQSDLWNCFFCCIIVVISGSMLDAAIRRVSRKSFYNCQITLTLQTQNAYYNLRSNYAS